MADTTTFRADYAALNELIVNCPDFERLEALLGGFNLFQVLDFEYGEIRHSNVLAWILDPAESHGLDDSFLKKWLMRVIHESSDETDTPVSAVDIDGWQLVGVEVRREWKDIDLLLVLTLAGKQQWVVCIENKINSKQHSNQLPRYRSTVEKEFSEATGRIFVFLTKHYERPDDESFVVASYAQVHQALEECLKSRSHAIGSEPKVLLENYLRLLEEKFMDESEIARTALRIYQQHRRALDVIFEHRPDNMGRASGKIQKLLEEHAEELGIQMEPATKYFLRFIPRAWDQPGNTHGTAYSGSNRTILFEIDLSASRPSFYAIAGKPPDAWIDPIWQRVGSPPFHQPKRAIRPRVWCTLHRVDSANISLEGEDVKDPSDMAQKIFKWFVKSYQSPDTQEVIKILAAELPRLHTLQTSTKA